MPSCDCPIADGSVTLPAASAEPAAAEPETAAPATPPAGAHAYRPPGGRPLDPQACLRASAAAGKVLALRRAVRPGTAWAVVIPRPDAHLVYEIDPAAGLAAAAAGTLVYALADELVAADGGSRRQVAAAVVTVDPTDPAAGRPLSRLDLNSSRDRDRLNPFAAAVFARLDGGLVRAALAQQADLARQGCQPVGRDGRPLAGWDTATARRLAFTPALAAVDRKPVTHLAPTALVGVADPGEALLLPPRSPRVYAAVRRWCGAGCPVVAPADGALGPVESAGADAVVPVVRADGGVVKFTVSAAFARGLVPGAAVRVGRPLGLDPLGGPVPVDEARVDRLVTRWLSQRAWRLKPGLAHVPADAGLAGLPGEGLWHLPAGVADPAVEVQVDGRPEMGWALPPRIPLPVPAAPAAAASIPAAD